jgi:DNA-binding MarR family transcriptional regulator
MTKSSQFSQVIRAWMDVFMHRSMHGWSHFAKSTGLSLQQFGILMQLHHRGGCGVSGLSEHFDITNAAVSQLVDKLVQGGLIRRDEDPHDRRAKTLTLTERGRELIQQGIEERYRWMDLLADKLTAEERAKVGEALTILTETARKAEEKESIR